MLFRLFISDRQYNSWKLFGIEEPCESPDFIIDGKNTINDNNEINSGRIKELLPDFCPSELKMFSGDVFSVDIAIQYKNENSGNSIYRIVYSLIREKKSICGVLVLSNARAFGRTENKKRLLYQCIPDDPHCPIFLVPYDLKLGFSKDIRNKYVEFVYDNWNEKHEHPYGKITNVFGDVDDLSAFYEYQIVRKNVRHSISEFSKIATQKFASKPTNPELRLCSINSIVKSGYTKLDFIPEKTKNFDKFREHIDTILSNPNFVIENRTDDYVFTIDPEGSRDLDDGISISRTQNESGLNGWKVSVYIANVFLWMETFSLWKHTSKRVSTMYLPDHNRPLLPPIMADELCSLVENKRRFAFCMDVWINENFHVLDVKFSNCIIKVRKNFRYESELLLSNNHYRMLDELTRKLSSATIDSHDVVSYWMVLMNTKCGEQLAGKKRGVFRTTESIAPFFPSISTLETINTWRAKYTVFPSDAQNPELRHETMNVDTYVHITSPIRRLVDQINQFIFFKEFGFVHNVSLEGIEWLDSWLDNLDCINRDMKTIRKIQTDCELMHLCTTRPEIMDEEFEGIVLNKSVDSCGIFTYSVFLEKINMISKICSEIDYMKIESLIPSVNKNEISPIFCKDAKCIENVSGRCNNETKKIYCKLYIFKSEIGLYRKVRVQIL